MLSRSSILATVVALCLIVYGILTVATIRKSFRTFVVVICCHEHHKEVDTEPYGLPLPTISKPAPIIIFGVPVPISNVVAGLLIIPGVCITHDVATWRRRRRRERLRQCLECGHPLHSWRGRCPGCGVRLGPDPGVKVHVLRG
jgi:hypothetical protein